MPIRRFALLVVVAVCVGCGGGAEAPDEAVDAPPVSELPPPPAAAPAGSPVEAPPAEAPAPAAPSPAAEESAGEVKGQPVEGGIGAKSKRLEGSGYLGSTVRVIPFAEETLQFAQAKRALDLYKAGNDGRGPATHEEYMEKIIKENMVRLPELPEGHEYRYDPETEQLLDVEIGNR